MNYVPQTARLLLHSCLAILLADSSGAIQEQSVQAFRILSISGDKTDARDRQDGTVERAEVQGARLLEVKLRCERQGRQWILAPDSQDGAAIQMKQNTSIHVNVIKSR